MIPFRITSASHAANQSPSIFLEKGAYRMRAPSARPQTDLHRNSRPRTRQTSHIGASPNLAILVVLLTCSCLASFGVAYYLFVTRWETRTFSQWRLADHPNEVIPVKFFHPSHTPLARNDPHERFLAYLPHSGFHNQRIAFENALVLARLLDRTLLVPSIRLGDKPIRYVNFDALHQFLVLSDKDGLYHCAKVPSHVSFPLECSGYLSHTHITWDWLVNLTDVKSQQRLVQRWNMTDTWIRDYLGISDAQTLTFRDHTPYHFRFLDTLVGASPSTHKYLEDIYLPDLALSTERLIHLGTLFGSSRLRLKNSTNIAIRGSIRKSMSYANPSLVHAAALISESLGGSYLGAHVRLGDGIFKANAEDNARIIWWKLVNEVLEYSVKESLELEYAFCAPMSVKSKLGLVPPNLDIGYHHSGLNLSAAEFIGRSPPRLGCRGYLHTTPHSVRLNTPLFISTDLPEPTTNSLLAGFRRTFPCIFFLDDFSTEIAHLDKLQNAHDGVMLRLFLLPLLDAMVVGKAWKVVGTEKSTFSRFVQDVLWRSYHGMEIIQRG